MVVVGQHQHYPRIRPGNGFGNGLSAGGRSRQWALVFSQKVIAVISPPLSAVDKEPEIIALASATPRSSSTRKRLRSVLGAQPTILAISAPERPTVRRFNAGGNDRSRSCERIEKPAVAAACAPGQEARPAGTRRASHHHANCRCRAPAGWYAGKSEYRSPPHIRTLLRIAGIDAGALDAEKDKHGDRHRPADLPNRLASGIPSPAQNHRRNSRSHGRSGSRQFAASSALTASCERSPRAQVDMWLVPGSVAVVIAA